MTNRVYLKIGKDAFKAWEITDVDAPEMVTFAIGILNGRYIEWIAGVGEGIDIDDPSFEIGLSKDIVNEIAADKPAAPGNQKILYLHVRSSMDFL